MLNRIKNFLTKEVSIDVLDFIFNITLITIIIILISNLSVIAIILISTMLFAFLFHNIVTIRKINTRNYNESKNKMYEDYSRLKSFTLEEIVNDKILTSNYLINLRDVIKEKEKEGK